MNKISLAILRFFRLIGSLGCVLGLFVLIFIMGGLIKATATMIFEYILIKTDLFETYCNWALLEIEKIRQGKE